MNNTSPRFLNGNRKRMVFVGVSILAVLFGISVATPKLRSRRGIIADWERRGVDLVATGNSPAWLRKASPYLADLYEQRYPELSYIGGSLDEGESLLSDEDLRNLRHFREVRWVHLKNSRITNEGLASLKGMEIKSVCLWDVPISDRGISQLAGIMNLESLVINRSQITSQAFSESSRMPHLIGLEIIRNQLEQNETLDLKGVRQISQLKLRENDLTDEAIKGLSVLTNLTELELKEPELTDVGLSVVATLPALQKFNLINMQINDAGLAQFRSMKQLKEFRLEGTKVTLKGVEAFRESRPDCQVYAGNFELHGACFVVPGYELTEE